MGCHERGGIFSWLLNEDTEPAEVCSSSSLFHSGIVLATKCCLSSVVLQRGTSNLSLVRSPREALVLRCMSSSPVGTAISSCSILYMKDSLLMRRRSSSVSRPIFSSIEETLDSRLKSLQIHLAALRWVFSRSCLWLAWCGSQMTDAYSRPDLTIET